MHSTDISQSVETSSTEQPSKCQGCGQFRKLYSLELQTKGVKLCKRCAMQAGWTKQDLRALRPIAPRLKWGNDPKVNLTIGPSQHEPEVERHCDREDGHKHCENCDECEILGNNVYILMDKDKVWFKLCRKCATSDKYGFEDWDLTYKKRFSSTAYDKD